MPRPPTSKVSQKILLVPVRRSHSSMNCSDQETPSSSSKQTYNPAHRSFAFRIRITASAESNKSILLKPSKRFERFERRENSRQFREDNVNSLSTEIVKISSGEEN